MNLPVLICSESSTVEAGKQYWQLFFPEIHIQVFIIVIMNNKIVWKTIPKEIFPAEAIGHNEQKSNQ